MLRSAPRRITALVLVLPTVFAYPLVACADDAGEQSLSEMVRQILLDNVPRDFAGDNDWGRQREVASGLKFDRSGGRLKVERRTKEVNDGLWTNYHVTLVDPTQNLRVKIAGLRRVGPGRLAFQVFLSAQLDGEARYERWRRGIKMLNFKADAGSTIEAVLDCEVALRIAPGAFLGDLLIEPKVNGVRLALVDIDLERVSRIDGAVAEELGDRLRRALERGLRGRETEIADKLNEAARKNPDRLRISSARVLAAGWSKAQELLISLTRPAVGATPQKSQ